MADYALGIDPGKTGAIAVVGRRVCEVWDMPQDYCDLARLMHEIEEGYDPKVAAIEKVNAGPQFGTVGNFTFGKGFGAVQMAVLMLGIPLHLVMPRAWQKFVIGFPARTKPNIPEGTDPKDEKKIRTQHNARHRKAIKAYSLTEAKMIFPDADLNLQKHHGRADAIHIARFALAQL